MKHANKQESMLIVLKRVTNCINGITGFRFTRQRLQTKCLNTHRDLKENFGKYLKANW